MNWAGQDRCYRQRTEDRIRPKGSLALRLSYGFHRKRWYKPRWPLELLGQFFSRPDFFKPELFPDPDFSPDPEIAISPRNLKIVPVWDFRFLHFSRSIIFTTGFFVWIFLCWNGSGIWQDFTGYFRINVSGAGFLVMIFFTDFFPLLPGWDLFFCLPPQL